MSQQARSSQDRSRWTDRARNPSPSNINTQPVSASSTVLSGRFSSDHTMTPCTTLDPRSASAPASAWTALFAPVRRRNRASSLVLSARRALIRALPRLFGQFLSVTGALALLQEAERSSPLHNSSRLCLFVRDCNFFVAKSLLGRDPPVMERFDT